MKNRKKKIAAAVVAVCIIAGLAVFLHKPNAVVETTQTPEVTTAEITAAEIKIVPPKVVTTEEENPSESLDEPTDESETDAKSNAEKVEEIVQDFTEATKPEPPKPPEIPSEQATNPAIPPTYTPEQAVREVTTSAPKVEKQPQGGEKKNGQIYIPGFGWIKDEGGGAKSTPATGMKENGNKIGTFG